MLPETVSLLAFSFTAGAATFFAPCAYPLLPGYISYYLGRETEDGTGPLVPRLVRAVAVGLLVSAGFVLVYAVLAGVVVTVGSRYLAGISILELVVGVLLVVVGGLLATGRKLPTPPVRLPERRRSAGGYVGFGVVYAAAAAGCTAPIFVGVVLASLSAGPRSGLAALGAYAAGMSAVMLVVTVAAALGRAALLTWLTRRMDHIHRGAGVLLIVAGLVQVYFFLFRFDGLALFGL